MTNKELIVELSKQLGWTHERVSEVLSETVDFLNHKLADSSEISIPNLGVIQTQKHAERISINPKTNTRILVPPKITVNFQPASDLKEKY